MTVKKTSESIPGRLRELDALFSSGGLQHSRRKRKAAGSGAPKRAAIGATAAKPSRQRGGATQVLRVPEWKQYGWLIHGFSTRAGGVSTVYRPGKKSGDMNLGLTPADSHENVTKNRELFVRTVLSGSTADASKTSLAMLRQIHSGLVHRWSANTFAAGESAPKGDGWIGGDPGVLLAIQTADCIPILVADVRQRIVGAFHAGWRGTLARIAERGVGRMRAEFGSRPGDLTAAIGPGIGRCCYSVGEEVRMEFTSQFAYSEKLFEEVFDLDPIKQKYPMLFLTARAPGHSNLGPSIHLDLAEANRRQLLDAGVEEKNIHMLGLCTACDTKRFFSYRAEQEFTGRMLSVIGVGEK